MPRTLTAADRSRLIRLASTLPKGSPERKALLAGLRKTATSSLIQKLVQSIPAVRGTPKVKGFSVTDEGVLVNVDAELLLPTSLVKSEVRSAPPQEAASLVMVDPTLLIDTVPASAIPVLSDAEFKMTVKRMGGLSRYPKEVLVALMEGRKGATWLGAEMRQANWDAFRQKANEVFIGTNLDSKPHDVLADITVKNGVLTGTEDDRDPKTGYEGWVVYGDGVKKPFRVGKGSYFQNVAVPVDVAKAHGLKGGKSGDTVYDVSGVVPPFEYPTGDEWLAAHWSPIKFPLSAMSRGGLEKLIKSFVFLNK